MRVLVTGHKGYIGTVMVPMLVQAGHTVVGLDRDFFQECTFCSGIFEVAELRVDVRDVRTSNLESFDANIHLASSGFSPCAALSAMPLTGTPEPSIAGRSSSDQRMPCKARTVLVIVDRGVGSIATLPSNATVRNEV